MEIHMDYVHLIGDSESMLNMHKNGVHIADLNHAPSYGFKQQILLDFKPEEPSPIDRSDALCGFGQLFNNYATTTLYKQLD